MGTSSVAMLIVLRSREKIMRLLDWDKQCSTCYSILWPSRNTVKLGAKTSCPSLAELPTMVTKQEKKEIIQPLMIVYKSFPVGHNSQAFIIM